MGAGPAGLTAAYELLTRTDVVPIVLEKSEYMGGISRTLNYKGNRMDIGGHRFFSKSDRVMQWWQERLPLQKTDGQNATITYQRATREVALNQAGSDPNCTDRIMLIRQRKSRIYFLRKLFEYPISLSKDTLTKLGIIRTIRIGFSYLRSALFPVKNVKNLEDFFVNRFGRELYRTFFKSYTEKVWGVACNEISAEWGQQRIKGLSITKTITHAIKRIFRRKGDISQKQTETSLIEQFMYPKYGPGQMWEEVAKSVLAMGGEIHTHCDVTNLSVEGNRITGVTALNSVTGETSLFAGDFFFSTIPIKELVRSLQTGVPESILKISDGLIYRDFITVGLLLNSLKLSDKNGYARKLVSDNWIYIQEPDVQAGRLQIFNNWSPYLVADPTKVWVGVEYFCYESDELWSKTDEEMSKFCQEEVCRIGIIETSEVLDSYVFRMPKTYPAYFGTYTQFEELRKYLDDFENLFLVGRNGMHKYNNQDHSMLTAMIAVDNIASGRLDKANIWEVNTEMDYHETKAVTSPSKKAPGSVTGVLETKPAAENV